MKKKLKIFAGLVTMTCLLFNFMQNSLAQESDYHIHPVPFTSVNMTDNFWAPKIKKNHDVTIPHGFQQSANRLLNFEIAAKLKSGTFSSEYPFDDSDIYKMIEAASYSLYYFPDPELEKYIDSLIAIIGMAQEPDGYLYTNRTIANINGTQPHPWAGNARWVNVHILSHELYNLGHLFESAVAYYQATGKNNLMNIAVKAADLIDGEFGWGKNEDYPGHQIVEAGLARLYRATGEERYLDLAKFFLDVRGPGGEEYCQAHKKVVDQTEAVGHAVRAVYMYAGMADIAALKNDSSYVYAIDKIWEDIVQKKIYVTGGIGASGGNEGFNGAFNLPNGSAYCETCASVGNVYLNHRLFLLHGDARYIDILERTLYNALLSGISLSGDRFFYSNPLLSNGNYQRSSWFGCACCPPNIARLIPSVPGYMYARTSDTIYVNLFAKNTAVIDLQGNVIEIRQDTDYPWDGKIDITVSPETEKYFTIMLRIPGWARNEAIPGGLYSFYDQDSSKAVITVNGEVIDTPLTKGYASIQRNWKQGDAISMVLPMNPRKLVADERIAEDMERIAIQRGPIVFCAEGTDNDNNILTLTYDKEMDLGTAWESSLLEGTEVIVAHIGESNGEQDREVKLIPYFLWNNRGPSEMQVWLSVREPRVLPDSLIRIDENAGDFASTNFVSSWENLKSIYDLYDPASSGDKGPGAFGNWQYNGGTVGVWNWVQYNFHKQYTISSSDVYWWNDNQGITLPDSSYLSYWDNKKGRFKAIPETFCDRTNGCVEWNKYNRTHFPDILTDKIRLNFIGHQKAQGILEWMVYTPGNIVNIEDTHLNQNNQCKLYPNPADDIINIQLLNSGNAEITVFDYIGKLILKRTMTGKTVITKDELAGNGLYVIKVTISGNDQYSRFIVM
jgi:DUF1680 family protein